MQTKEDQKIATVYEATQDESNMNDPEERQEVEIARGILRALKMQDLKAIGDFAKQLLLMHNQPYEN